MEHFRNIPFMLTFYDFLKKLSSHRIETVPWYVWVPNQDNGNYMMRHHNREILPASFPCKKGSNAVDVEPTLAHVVQLEGKPEVNVKQYS